MTSVWPAGSRRRCTIGLTEPLVYMKGTKVLAQDAAMSQLDVAMMRHIEATLATGPYILGQRFTAVDILYMSLFEHARPLLGAAPWLDAYLARADRPARRRAISKDSVRAKQSIR